jgi:hypothetical protein
MKSAVSPEAELLREIGGGDLCWLSHAVGTANFAGRSGWLRYQSALVAGTSLPPQIDAGELLSGEWTIDVRSSARARTENGALIVRTITDSEEPMEGWRPALRQKKTMIARGAFDKTPPSFWIDGVPAGDLLVCHVYFGFRTDKDFGAGKITRITERFAGFAFGATEGDRT